MLHAKGLSVGFIALVFLLVWSGWHPYNRATWFMEVLPILIAVPILIATRQRFPLTTLLYVLIFVHSVILLVGGAYTYARVPFGFQLAEWFDLSRNPYDKIGHFAQGLVPAIAAREILLRGGHVRAGNMLAFLVCATVLGISASYELIEWSVALLLEQGANEFLGTQGDPWDTQSDMLFALLGAVFALLVFSREHDRQMRALSAAK